MESKKVPNPSPSKKKVEEIHHASALIGNIIEKGFSSRSSAKPPQPSVIPFPVARHRSHGPHWSPANAEPNPDENELLDDQDNNADFGPISSFAGPIKRKEKKGLDFGNWRELLAAEGNKPQSKKPEAKPLVKKAVAQPEIRDIVASQPKVETIVAKNERNIRNLAAASSSSTNGVERSEREPELPAPNGLESPTLMDEIEAENLARLSQMSRDEIVEAQAEVIGKMDPRLLDMLKKRGRDKSEGKNDARGKAEGEKKQKMGASDGDRMPTGDTSNSSWKIWSERVEKVRELRFALDGSVVKARSAQQQLNGDKFDGNQYSVENVAERDFLRTEGDPAAAGYTIKEAVALIRSVVPGQRVLALQLLASICNKALYNLQGKGELGMGKISPTDKLIDWQAVWAFALGPEPQIALSLRIALDDNHDSVVLSCAKTIQCILSCDLNESFFSITEKVPITETFLCTAPIFRSKPEVDGGDLRGGFWKYNTKPSNILPSNVEEVDDTNEGARTIQDDIVVAGQDVAAGFIRMGILPRICYLLEMDPLRTLEECLLSVLIALARHSPTSASAIMRCPRLIETVIKMFTRSGTAEIPAQIKAILLLKVLSQSDKQICLEFVRHGTFQKAMWQWYRSAFTLEQWMESGKENCKLTSSLMVEQLRLWRVCINYGYCIPYFGDFFPAMCLWLSLPTFDKLIEKKVLDEFTSVTRESYLILEALARRLPLLHSVDQLSEQAMHIPDVTMEGWSWGQVLPMVNLAVEWLSLKNVPFVSSFVSCHHKSMGVVETSASHIIWVISAVLHMLCSTFDTITSAVTGRESANLPWIPEFVPKVGFEIIRNGFLNFDGLADLKPIDCLAEGGSLVDSLCYLREQNDIDASFSSVSCLHGLVRLTSLIDRSVHGARSACDSQLFKVYKSETADKILEEGIVKWAKIDLAGVLSVFMTLVQAEWHFVQSVEMFGRGGPAPGIGIGWGSSSGGFWSWDALLAEMDVQFIVQLFEVFKVVLEEEPTFSEGMCIVKSAAGMDCTSRRINCVLAVCLIAGPKDRRTIEKALDQLLQVPVFKHLNLCIRAFFQCHKRFKSFEWQYEESDFKYFSEILNCHFKNRWMSVKKKSSSKVDSGSNNQEAPGKGNVLETIQEDQEISDMSDKYPDRSSLLTEWAHQRLPLPVHWFLSPICTILETKNMSTCSSSNVSDVAKSGLYLLLGLESMSYFLSSDLQHSTISGVSLVWKLHALSKALHADMNVLSDEKSRDIFETLQELYGQHLDRLRIQVSEEQLDETDDILVSSPRSSKAKESGTLHLLNFQTQIHESYTTFIENLIEQFGAISYGDIIFGRQIALYLHQSVEQPVRLAAWNALSTAHLLELLPPMDKCFAEPEGYLMPVEEDESILEAYIKSWISGALDRAATRQSLSFSLALHHISCFIFKAVSSEKSSLRSKLARSLLRSYSQKKHQEGMMLNFVQYKLPMLQETQCATETARRLELLREACEGNSSLVVVVDRLKSMIK